MLLSFAPQARSRQKSQTSHKGYATPKIICFSNKTSTSPCRDGGDSNTTLLRLFFPWLLSTLCMAQDAEHPLHHPGTAGNAMECQACQQSPSASSPQAHAPKGVCSHRADTHPILPSFGNYLQSREESRGEKSSQKCLCCGNVNNANISAFKYVWNDRECQHVPHLPRNSFESLLP